MGIDVQIGFFYVYPNCWVNKVGNIKTVYSIKYILYVLLFRINIEKSKLNFKWKSPSSAYVSKLNKVYSLKW